MPAFDPLNPKGPAGAALYATASLLSTLVVFQELCEVVTAPLALAKLSIGIQATPNDQNEFSAEELKAIGFHANIHPPQPSQSVVVRGIGSPSSMTGGAFQLRLRRHARDGEILDHEDRNGLYLWWHDCITALQVDLINAAESVDCPRLRGVQPDCDGAFGVLGEVAAQAEYLWANFFILWGDEVEA